MFNCGGVNDDGIGGAVEEGSDGEIGFGLGGAGRRAGKLEGRCVSHFAGRLSVGEDSQMVFGLVAARTWAWEPWRTWERPIVVGCLSWFDR